MKHAIPFSWLAVPGGRQCLYCKRAFKLDLEHELTEEEWLYLWNHEQDHVRITRRPQRWIRRTQPTPTPPDEER